MANAFIELSTDNTKTALKFYQQVFGWKSQSVPGMDYTMLDMGKDKGGGGVTKKMMPGQPTAWMPYITVDNVKGAMARATKAGGKALVPFQSLGEMGAIGVFMDPSGAALGIWEAGKATAAPKAAAKKAVKKTAKKSAAKKATKVAGKTSTKKSANKTAKKSKR